MRKLEMSQEELDRVKILGKVIDGHLTQKIAAETLKISLRQIKRLCKRYRNKGAAGLIHLGRGKPSSRHMNKKIKATVTELMFKEELNGFGPTLLQETLEEEYAIIVSREWLRQHMVAEARWQPKKVKKTNIHHRRKRRSRRGELIQEEEE